MIHDKSKLYIIVSVMVIIILGVAYTIFRNGNSNSNVYDVNSEYGGSYYIETLNEEDLFIKDVDQNREILRVYISGQVKEPGVYDLNYGDRVVDILNLAGGHTQYADLERINLARHIEDGEHIIIPKIGEYIDQQNLDIVAVSNNLTEESTSNLININTADLNQLMTLPGIGSTIGQNIIDFREQNGHFSSIEEIQRVNRIGPATFENIRHLITV